MKLWNTPLEQTLSGSYIMFLIVKACFLNLIYTSTQNKKQSTDDNEKPS